MVNDGESSTARVESVRREGDAEMPVSKRVRRGRLDFAKDADGVARVMATCARQEGARGEGAEDWDQRRWEGLWRSRRQVNLEDAATPPPRWGARGVRSRARLTTEVGRRAEPRRHGSEYRHLLAGGGLDDCLYCVAGQPRAHSPARWSIGDGR
jgi:hypothetical protein